VSALAPDTSFGSPFPLAQVDETLSQQTRDLLLDNVSAQMRKWNETRGRAL
jgi:membrane-bound serine protease (ClpP class)